MCGDSAISATDVAGLDGRPFHTNDKSAKAEAKTRGEVGINLLVYRTSCQMHLCRFGLSSRPARLRIPKSSVSKRSFLFQKAIDLRRENAIFRNQGRVRDRRVQTPSF